ncbi:hypothetical protein [Diaphorobacter sp. HDW4A]|uniref:hypothetical protein n=1 Tax=Diaphorobacter sp. HDW4A TaxID=2714924 RepID=UPI001F1189EA|nr:hypothetical protein [Diaphorobacter sp. HDW4A]
MLGPAYAGGHSGASEAFLAPATESGLISSGFASTPAEGLDLALSFDDTRPPEIERSVLDSLPLHPVQRGMPDFELPEPRVQTLPHVKAAPVEIQRAPEPVTFEQFDDAGTLERKASANSGGGLKWLAVGVLAVLLVGSAGWFGYQHFAGGNAESVPAADAQPAQDGVADGESVVPAVAQDAVQDTAAAAEAVPVTTTAPVDAAATATVESGQSLTPSETQHPDQPVPVTVQPVHVLKDSADTGAVAKTERKRNKSLDNLLD